MTELNRGSFNPRPIGQVGKPPMPEDRVSVTLPDAEPRGAFRYRLVAPLDAKTPGAFCYRPPGLTKLSSPVLKIAGPIWSMHWSWPVGHELNKSLTLDRGPAIKPSHLDDDGGSTPVVRRLVHRPQISTHSGSMIVSACDHSAMN